MGSREGNKLGERRGSPDRLSKVGIEGPKMSVSRIPARWPSRARARVRLTILFLALSQHLIKFSFFSHCLSPKSKVPKKGKTEKRTSNSTFPHPSLCGRNGDYLAYIFDSALLG